MLKKWSGIAKKTLSAKKQHGRGGSSDEDEDNGVGASLENSEPELCIQLLRIPSINNYTGLKKRIQSGSQEWLEGFLELDGLGVLLDVVERLSGRGMSFADAYLQVEIVGCIKAVMNSKAGMDFLIESNDFTRKLARGKPNSPGGAILKEKFAHNTCQIDVRSMSFQAGKINLYC